MGMKGIKKLKENGFRSSAPILKKIILKELNMDFLKRWMRDFLCWKIIEFLFLLFFFFFFFFLVPSLLSSF